MFYIQSTGAVISGRLIIGNILHICLYICGSVWKEVYGGEGGGGGGVEEQERARQDKKVGGGGEGEGRHT